MALDPLQYVVRLLSNMNQLVFLLKSYQQNMLTWENHVGTPGGKGVFKLAKDLFIYVAQEQL